MITMLKSGWRWEEEGPRNTAILRKIKFISKENEWTKTSKKGERETYRLEKEGVRHVTKKQKMKRNNCKESREINLKQLLFSSQKEIMGCVYMTH